MSSNESAEISTVFELFFDSVFNFLGVQEIVTGKLAPRRTHSQLHVSNFGPLKGPTITATGGT